MSLGNSKLLKLFGVILGVVIANVLIFSPGFIGLSFGGGALEAATAVTLLFASALILLYTCYVNLFKRQTAIPAIQVKTHEDYIEALSQYKEIKTLQKDIDFSLGQLERLKKRMETLEDLLNQRFDPTEMSYKKFASVAHEVEKLFYLNIRSILNRLRVFDEAEYRSIALLGSSKLPQHLIQEKTQVFQEFFSFVKDSLATNEEILLKLDKLLMEISRLDSFDPGDIEKMECMQEIDSLIKQTKYYKE